MKRNLEEITNPEESRNEEPLTKEAKKEIKWCKQGCGRICEESFDTCCRRCGVSNDSDLTSDSNHNAVCNKRYAETPIEVASSLGTITSEYELEENDIDSKGQMRRLIDAIKDKEDWEEKIDNPTIVEKWRQEATRKHMKVEDFDKTLTMLREMREKYNLVSGTIDYSTLPKPDQTYVLESTDLIPSSLQQELIEYVKDKLEPKREEDKDWHPGTNEMVLDLVHPSLYCYVHGVSETNDKSEADAWFERTKKVVKKAIGYVDNYVMPVTDEQVKENLDINSRYQWMPAEVSIIHDKKDKKNTNVNVRFDSYINNLHEIIHKPLYHIIEKIFARFVPMFEELLVQRLPDHCQVIVKLSNIYLSKDKTYDGGVWHVEGVDHEHIIASGIYYYDIENVADSYLEFRKEMSEDDISYEQDDLVGVWSDYKMENGDPLNQHCGAIESTHGKCIVFTNNLQHRVTSFVHEDEEKNDGKAHRKILVFFLIDPKNRILSSRDVAVQQKNILLDYMHECFDPILTPDLSRLIVEYLPHMSLEQAREHRAKLMFGRKFYVDAINKLVYEREFSLCEH